MNNKALTMSLLAAILAVFFVQSYVQSIEERAAKEYGSKFIVLRAKKDIKEMETITDAVIERGTIPKNFLEPNAVYATQEEGEKVANSRLKELFGQVAIVPIKKGEQITTNKLMAPGVRTGLSSQITPGRRAIAIPVNDTTGVAKLVKPGDHIDLLGVIDMGGGRRDAKVVKTLLQDKVVLATGHSITNNVPRVMEADAFGDKIRSKSLLEDTSYNSVTLEVEPYEAQMMALLMASGDNALWVSLRNSDDTDHPASLAPMMYNDLLGVDPSRARAPAGK
jgi:pilus assembly protein CpaB